MKTLVLCAGKGTRLQPFTLNNPKPLVPINGIPLLVYTMAYLKSQGLSDILINLHHFGDKISSLLGDGSKINMNIDYTHEATLLGSGGTIAKNLNVLGENFLIANGDPLYTSSLDSLIQRHMENLPLATLSVHDHAKKETYGLIHHKNHRVLSLLSRPETQMGEAYESDMYPGIICFNQRKLDQVFRSRQLPQSFCIIRDVLIPVQNNQAETLLTERLEGFWQACDTMNDVAYVEQSLHSSVKLSYENLVIDFWDRLQS